jgi:hypothetical protein
MAVHSLLISHDHAKSDQVVSAVGVHADRAVTAVSAGAISKIVFEL